MTVLPSQPPVLTEDSLGSLLLPKESRDLIVYSAHLLVYFLVFVVIFMTRKLTASLLYEIGVDIHHFLRPRAGVSLPGPMPGGFGDEEAEAAREHAGAFGERFPQEALAPGIVFSVTGIVLAVLSLSAMGIFSNDMPLGIHWAVTATTLVILHTVIIICTISLLAYHPNSDQSHAQQIALFRATFEYSIIMVLLPLVSHAISKSPFTDLYPYTGGRRTVFIAVIAQPVVGLLLGIWAGVGRWWMGDFGEDADEL